MSSEVRDSWQPAAGSYAGEKLRNLQQDVHYNRTDPSRMLRQLPGALTEAGLSLAINELPVGARLAADTIYKCWREGKFAHDEFISFLQSISSYSPALHMMLRGALHESKSMGSAMPGTLLRGVGALGAGHFGAQFGTAGVGCGGGLAARHVMVSQVSEESEAAMGINKEWRERRRKEAARRQCAGIDGNEHAQRAGYLCRTFASLRQKLPPSALPALLDAVVSYSRRSSSPETFSQQMQDLVNGYQIVVPLDYVPQRLYDRASGGAAGDAVAKRSMASSMQSAGDENGKRGVAGMHGETSSKGIARGCKKSKPQMAPVAAVSLEDEAQVGGGSGMGCSVSSAGTGAPWQHVPYTVGGRDEVCPACEQGTAEDNRMVQCSACRRYFHLCCVMHNPYLARQDDFECGSENCPSYGRACRPSRYNLEDLADTPLGQYLTARSRSAVPNPNDLIIKVVSDKDMYKHVPELSTQAFSNGNPCDAQGYSYSWCSYRSKCILGFRRFCSSGSQVVFLGMYVHEYGWQCGGPNRGRVLVECLDSTPLYSEERPGERQEILSNIMLAYFEFVSAQGFEFAHIRVPPPTDAKGYIFAARTVNVRLRAAMHLAHWFKRLLQVAMQQGIIENFQSSPHNSTINFPPSLLEPAQLASDIAFHCGDEEKCWSGGSMGSMPGGAGGAEDKGEANLLRAGRLQDWFFAIKLATTEAGRAVGQGGPFLPSKVAGGRAELVSLFEQEGLHFHTLAHNNYSTMMLVHHLMEEQRMFTTERRLHLPSADGPQQQQQQQHAEKGRGFARAGGPARAAPGAGARQSMQQQQQQQQHMPAYSTYHQHHQNAGHPYQQGQAQRMDMLREGGSGGMTAARDMTPSGDIAASGNSLRESTMHWSWVGDGGVGGGLGPESGRAQVADKGRGSPTRFRAPYATTSASHTGDFGTDSATAGGGISSSSSSSSSSSCMPHAAAANGCMNTAHLSAHSLKFNMHPKIEHAAARRGDAVCAAKGAPGALGSRQSARGNRGVAGVLDMGKAVSKLEPCDQRHEGSESTQAFGSEQTDSPPSSEQTESPEQADSPTERGNSLKDDSPRSWDQGGNSQENADVEQGEEVMQNLLGHSIHCIDNAPFIETCNTSAPTLEDMRQSQGEVGLTSEEQQVWSSQDQADWADLYGPSGVLKD